MGRVNIPAARLSAKTYEIKMRWHQDSGTLFITGGNENEKDVIVLVNEAEFSVDFDKSGSCELSFEPSNPAQFYAVRLKNPDKKSDERMGFFY